MGNRKKSKNIENENSVINVIEDNKNNDLKNKINLIVFIVFMIYVSQYIIVGEHLLQIIFNNSIEMSVFKNKNFYLLMMLSYYIAIIINQKTLNSIKSVILNIIGMIGFYNLLLAFNPLNTIEMSSDYIVSNILYLYLSFLLFSLDFNISKKLIFLAELSFVIKSKIKKISKKKIFFLLLLFLGYARYWTTNSGELIIPTITLITFSIFIILIKENVSLDDNRAYLELRQKIEKVKKFDYLEKIIEWILDVFKIEKLKTLETTDNKSKIYKFNIFFIVFVKYLMPYSILLMYYEFQDEYYEMYQIENKNLCTNISKDSENNDIKIIKLKNENVLIVENETKFKKGKYLGETVKLSITSKYLNEKDCIREKIKIKHMIKDKIKIELY